MSWHGRGDLTASCVLIFPALLIYQIGVLFAGHVNGADVVTRALFDALGRDVYLALQGVIAAGYLLWLRRNRRWTTLRWSTAAPVLLEAALYALTLGAAISLVLERVLGMGITGGNVISAFGAGVHEELVFRLALLGGLVALAQREIPQHPRIGLALAIAASSILFAAAHHAGHLGEPFTPHSFVFRCLAGAAFALVFWYRSLAHVVYAHILYDLLVYWRG
jgi:hypothetical protein